jgi:two-component system chemotaxis response regulator CheB
MPNSKRLPRRPTDFSCPDCAGVLKLEGEGSHHREYQCQVGHRFSTRSLLIAKEKEAERALWSAAALLEHIVLVYGRLIEEGKDLKSQDRRSLEQRLREARRQQQAVISLIENTHAWQ